MNRLAAVFLVTMLALVASAPAYAQATRSWVSGVGDDANPCSRTAPCKTYAGAISKTAAGGEISVLDPGGFGAVTISKAMTLEGDGDLASTTVWTPCTKKRKSVRLKSRSGLVRCCAIEGRPGNTA